MTEVDASVSSSPADATFQLLARAKQGDSSAVEILFARYLEPLRRFASGRLPAWARSATDTHDLVQDTLLNAFRRIDTFEPRRIGAFQAYLRQAVLNRIRDVQRRARVRPIGEPLTELEPAAGVSPLEEVISLEAIERYERALQRLTAEDREAIIGRIELGNSFAELAVVLEKPSPDAARMAVSRALLKLAAEIERTTVK